MRILNVPSQTGVVWQFTINGQFTSTKFLTLDDVLAPCRINTTFLPCWIYRAMLSVLAASEGSGKVRKRMDFVQKSL